MEAEIKIALASFFVTYVFMTKDCPFNICKNIRNKFSDVVVLNCFFCFSFWLNCVIVTWYSFKHSYSFDDFVFKLLVSASVTNLIRIILNTYFRVD